VIPTLIQIAVFAGLTGWIPAGGPDRSAWIGLRLTLAIALADLLLFGLGWLGGFPFSEACWMVVIAAAAGWGLLIRQARPLSPWLAAHPVIVLPLILLAALALHGPVAYLPAVWDEYSNWLYWTREIFSRDQVWTEAMNIPLPGYTPGLPLLMAMPSALLGHFTEGNSLTVQFFMHVGLLAMVFDLARANLARRGAEARLAGILAWLLVLTTLGLEATWKLLPTLQLIEKPQIYAFSAFAMLIVAAMRLEIHPLRLGVLGGLLLVYAFLIKLATQVFLPAAAIMALPVLWRHSSRRTALALGLALPPAAMLVIWKLYGIPDPSHWNSLGVLLDLEREHGEDWMIARVIRATELFWPAVMAYLALFKPWLDLIALGGFALAWKRREARFGLAALLLFLLGTEFALYLFHIKYAWVEPNSVDRFTRVPLRPLHLMGVVLGGLMVLEVLIDRVRPALLARALPVLAVLAAAGLGGQAVLLGRSLAPMEARDAYPGVHDIRAQAWHLAQVMEARGQTGGTVQIIDQGSDAYSQVIARYSALRLDGRTRIKSFEAIPKVSFDRQDDPAAEMARAGAIWPITLTPSLAANVAALADSPECREAPARFFLLARPGGGFTCVAK